MRERTSCWRRAAQRELTAVADQIRGLGRSAVTVPTDVIRRDQVDALAAAVRREFGRLDVLVNNAGGGLERSGILESDPDLWLEDVTVNCISAYLVSRALLPLMIESGGGRVINVGSGMGHRPTASASAYHVGKAGMWMFTRCLAEEVWQHNIAVNEIVPGPVATRLTGGRMQVGGPAALRAQRSGQGAGRRGPAGAVPRHPAGQRTDRPEFQPGPPPALTRAPAAPADPPPGCCATPATPACGGRVPANLRILSRR